MERFQAYDAQLQSILLEALCMGKASPSLATVTQRLRALDEDISEDIDALDRQSNLSSRARRGRKARLLELQGLHAVIDDLRQYLHLREKLLAELQ